jgi:arylsulfatase A-like enzyme
MTDDHGCSQHTTRLCDQVQAYMPFTASLPGGGWYVAQQAITHNSTCCPNRATYLTGQTNQHNGIVSNSACGPYQEAGSLPVALQEAGYQTGLFGKYLNCFKYPSTKWPVVPIGWDRMVAHQQDPSYYNFDLADEAGAIYTVPKGDASTYEPYYMERQAELWLDTLEADDQRPWLTYYTPFGPHSPGSACPDPECTPFPASSDPPNLPNFREGCPGATDPSIADKSSFATNGECTVPGRNRNSPLAQLGVDRAFERLYDHLTYLGEIDNTIILFVADNGMALGSHRIANKTCPWDECHTVPFMLRIPGSPGGDIHRMVSNLDVYSTLTELAGAPILRPQDGMSIVPLLTDPDAPWRTDQFLWNGKGDDSYRTLREDCQAPEHLPPNPCWVFIQYRDLVQEEVYDLNADPFQLTNLVSNPVTGYVGVLEQQDPLVVDLRNRMLESFQAAGGGKWPLTK